MNLEPRLHAQSAKSALGATSWNPLQGRSSFSLDCGSDDARIDRNPSRRSLASPAERYRVIMHLLTDIQEIKRLTRRGQRKTVIAELKRRGIRFDVAHDGWPVVYLSEVAQLPSTRPNFGGRKG